MRGKKKYCLRGLAKLDDRVPVWMRQKHEKRTFYIFVAGSYFLLQMYLFCALFQSFFLVWKIVAEKNVYSPVAEVLPLLPRSKTFYVQPSKDRWHGGISSLKRWKWTGKVFSLPGKEDCIYLSHSARKLTKSLCFHCWGPCNNNMGEKLPRNMNFV